MCRFYLCESLITSSFWVFPISNAIKNLSFKDFLYYLTPFTGIWKNTDIMIRAVEDGIKKFDGDVFNGNFVGISKAPEFWSTSTDIGG